MNKFQLAILIFISVALAGNAQNKTKNQGIQGDVRWLEGNQMPGPGVEQKEGKPIFRELLIYPAVTLDQTSSGAPAVFITKVNVALIKRIKTRKDGTFRVSLPPGRYSIFSVEPEGLWINTFDGDGLINAITVLPEQYAVTHIRIDYKAYY